MNKLICNQCQKVSVGLCLDFLATPQTYWYECDECGLAGDPGPDKETALENWKKVNNQFCQACGNPISQFVPHLAKNGFCSWNCWADLYGERP